MNMMSQPSMRGAPSPMPMPTPEMIEEAKRIADASTWEEVSAILRSDDRRHYTIDIETTATTSDNDIEEKAQRIEYVRAMTEMMQVWAPAIQMNPSIMPFGKEVMKFGAQTFKVGRTLEEAMEDSFEQIQQTPPQPDPEAQKAKQEMEMKQADLQARMQEKQADMQMRMSERQQDMEFKRGELEMKAQSMWADLEMKKAQAAQDMEFRRQEMSMKAEEMQHQRDNSVFDFQLRQQEFSAKRDDAQFGRQVQAEDMEFKRSEAEASRSMAKDDQDARHAMDYEKLQGEHGASPRQQVAKQIEELTAFVQQAIGELSEQQSMIAQALNGVAQEQQQSSEALDAMMGHMTAPRKAKRDPKTRKVVGVEIDRSAGMDRKAMLERLMSDDRPIIRGADNRIEAFG